MRDGGARKRGGEVSHSKEGTIDMEVDGKGFGCSELERRRKRRQSRRGQRHNRNNATAIYWRDSLGRRREKIRRRRTVFKTDLGKWWKAATDEAEEERAHHHRMKGLP